MREQVHRLLVDNGIPEQQADQLVLGLNEACMNIIEHAYGTGGQGDIILDIVDEPGWIQFELTDFAPPIDIERIKPRDLSDIRPGGLGTHFIQEIMDEVSYRRHTDKPGNLLQMRKRKD